MVSEKVKVIDPLFISRSKASNTGNVVSCISSDTFRALSREISITGFPARSRIVALVILINVLESLVARSCRDLIMLRSSTVRDMMAVDPSLDLSATPPVRTNCVPILFSRVIS